MEMVRSKTGAPVLSDFADARGTPLVVDRDSGSAYVLTTEGGVADVKNSVISVMDMRGVIGNGSHDDYSGIQRALDRIPTDTRGGYYIQFPAGQYYTSQGFTVTSRWASFIGSGATLGPNGTILRTNEAGIDMISATSALIDSFSVRDMVIWGAGKGTGVGRGIVLGVSGDSSRICFSSVIQDCWITAMPDVGIDFLNASDCRVLNGAVENCATGVKIHGTTYTQGGAHYLNGVTLFGNTDAAYITTDTGGAATQYTENIRIQHCIVWLNGTNPGGAGDNTHGGIIIDAGDLLRPGVRSPQINGNHFRGNVGDIRLRGYDGVAGNNTGINNPSINGNHSDRGFRQFLSLAGVNGASVVGNIIDSCNQEGLALCDAVEVTGASDRTFLDGNVTNNLPSAPYQPTYGLSTGVSTTNTIQGSNRWDGKTGAKNILGTTLAAN